MSPDAPRPAGEGVRRDKVASARYARIAGMRPGETVRAKVKAVMDHGIHLEKCGVQILVHVVDVEWYHSMRPDEYASVGDELDVTILRMTDDGQMASGWLAVKAPSQRAAG